MEQLQVFEGRFQWDQSILQRRNDIHSEDTPEGRIYRRADGRAYWSMTTMLGATEEDTGWYEAWVNKLGKEAAEAESARCCDRGEKIHLGAEMYVRNYPEQECVDASGEYRRLYAQLKNALNTRIGTVFACELPVMSDLMKVGGRLDLCAEWGGVPSIIDYKGSNFLKSREMIETYRHQLCGYSFAVEEMYDFRATRLVNIIANERSPVPTVLIADRSEVAPALASRIKRFITSVGLPK